jgi:hypothetical protein
MDMHTFIGGSTNAGVPDNKLILSLKPNTNNAVKRLIFFITINNDGSHNIVCNRINNCTVRTLFTTLQHLAPEIN